MMTYFPHTKILPLVFWMSGMLTAPCGPEGNAWLNVGFNPDPKWPDLQMVIVSVTPAHDGGLLIQRSLGYNRKVSG